MDVVVNVVIVALAAAVFWLACQPDYVFLVRLEGAAPRVTRGKVTAAFLRQLGEACAEFGVSRGWVGGVRRGRRVALAFSRHVPEACRQRLRNLWEVHG